MSRLLRMDDSSLSGEGAFGFPRARSVRLGVGGGASDTAEGTADFDAHTGDLPSGTVELPGPAGAPPVQIREVTPRRFREAGLLGRGGRGEVLRVYDALLGRFVAMKTTRDDIGDYGDVTARFLQEARVAAQLQHPSIVSLHELASLPDGRLCFTMPEVQGRTLSEAIRAAHQAGHPDRALESTPLELTHGTWTLRRLIEVLHRVCETVAYAHSRGVIHRDLKPANIMVGEYGQVFVLDWGLARRSGSAEPASAPIHALDSAELMATPRGGVKGTPAYMAPEQARGDVDAIGPLTDVYALGAVLFEILDGAPPFLSDRSQPVHVLLRQVRCGAQPPFQRPIPADLEAVCRRAMSADPEARYPSARALAEALRAWLDGVQKREAALDLVRQAAGHSEQLGRCRAEALRLQAEAEAELHALGPWATLQQKQPLWDQQDRALELEGAALEHDIEVVRLLRSALTHAPDLPEALAAMAAHYHDRHARFEAAGDIRGAARAEVWLRHYDRGAFARYLRGEGRLRVGGPPLPAQLFRYRTVQRRLVPEPVGETLTLPLDLELPMGSYVLRIEGPSQVDLPVLIERNAVVDGRRSAGDAPSPLCLESLPEQTRAVPAGWFWSGDKDLDNALPRRRLWVHAFLMDRFPTTNLQYLAFLNDLVARGNADEAEQWCPRGRPTAADPRGECAYGRDEAGRYFLTTDADGDLWQPDWPVCRVNWPSACAYAQWRSERTGRLWRLPTELEWEKTARGVDGRAYPWGNFFDAAWARMRYSAQGESAFAVVDSAPVDCSPFGVRGLAGNVSDWCLNAPDDIEEIVQIGGHLPGPAGPPGLLRAARGGNFSYSSRFCHVAARQVYDPQKRFDTVGFRLISELH